MGQGFEDRLSQQLDNRMGLGKHLLLLTKRLYRDKAGYIDSQVY